MEIICIDITNKCDLACSNCTRLLENQDRLWDMSLENFRLACRSLSGFTGTIAVIGGNPCMHRDFEGVCRIFREEIPNKAQRGLWSNNIFKHEKVVKDTFGGFNLNAHGSLRGIKSLKALYRKVKTGNLYLEHSSHSPLLTAVKDLFDTQEMWERISKCDINREWSATIIENKGQLRAYFCEVAASFDLANNTDNGIYPSVGWWNQPMETFSSQVKQFCPSCGVPARLQGSFDFEETDTFTKSNAHLAEKAQKKGRKVIYLTPGTVPTIDYPVTQYTDSHLRNRGTIVRLINGLKRRIARYL
jgi:hypothetical protein